MTIEELQAENERLELHLSMAMEALQQNILLASQYGRQVAIMRPIVEAVAETGGYVDEWGASCLWWL